MRPLLMALALMTSLVCAGTTPSFAGAVANPSASSTVSDTSVTKVQGYGYCQELRYRCRNKDRLGEWGEGNCRRYRDECGRGPSYCQRLRDACVYKDQRGEWGQGNCRRYRAECGGGY